MGRSLGRLFMKLPSICLQKQKNRWKETQQGSEISFICTMPSSWLQPALCMSATRAYPVHSAPGLPKPIHHPVASYLQGAWHTKLGLLSGIPATHAHPYSTHVDAHALCLLLQLGLVWSPGNLPKSELIRAKEKSVPAYVLGFSLVQPLSIQTASFVVWGDKGS